MKEEILNAAAVAEFKACGIATVYRAVRKGELRHERLPGSRFLIFRMSDVIAWNPAPYGEREEGVKKQRGPGWPRRRQNDQPPAPKEQD